MKPSKKERTGKRCPGSTNSPVESTILKPKGEAKKKPHSYPDGRILRKNAPGGASSNMPWHGNHALLAKFRLKDLNKYGYIDYKPAPMPPVMDDIHFEPTFKKAFNPSAGIHPIFERENFLDLAESDYDLLAPSIRLASALLYDSAAVRWFTSLFSSITPMMIGEDFKLPEHERLYKFGGRVPEGFNPYALIQPDQLLETWRRLAEMKKCTRWRFCAMDSASWAFALGGDLCPRGQPPWYQNKTTYHSIGHLTEEFLMVLRGDIRHDQFVKAQSFDIEAARLRTHFFLATTFVHEFAHMVWHACPALKPEGVTLHKYLREPFQGDQRIAELGHALTVNIFGNDMNPMGLNTTSKWVDYQDPSKGVVQAASASVPYGMAAFPWPGSVEPPPGVPTLFSAAFWGAKDHYMFGILMSDIHRYFTNSFWQRTVAQYGDRALNLPRTIGIKTSTPAGAYLPHEPPGTCLGVDPDILMPSDQSLTQFGYKLKQDEWECSSSEEE